MTREEILDAIWGTDFVAESNIVDRHIRSLRIKLQNDYRHPRFIETVPGRGLSLHPDLLERGLVRRASRKRTHAQLSVGSRRLRGQALTPALSCFPRARRLAAASHGALRGRRARAPESAA